MLKATYAFFLVLNLIPIARAEMLEIRTLKTSRAISIAIKTNLDGGTLSPERFEATYDKLAKEKKINELSRFTKNDATGALIHFETTAPDSHWKTIIEIEPAFGENFCQAMMIVIISPPSSKNPNEPPSIHSVSSGGFDYGTWHVLAEMNFGTEFVMSLGKFTKPDATPFPDDRRILAIEGHVVPMKEIEAANIGALPPEKLEAAVAKTLGSRDPFDSFRLIAMSGQKEMISKVADEYPGYKGIGTRPLAVRIETEPTVSPDSKFVYLRASVGIDEVDASTQGPAVYSMTTEDTFRVGTWKAVPAQRHPTGNNVILFVKVSHLRADRWKQNTVPPIKFASRPGKSTRTYPNIHPRFLSDPAHQNSGQTGRRKDKDILISYGVSDGNWDALYIDSNLLVKDADEKIHLMIEQVLANFTWDKYAQGK